MKVTAFIAHPDDESYSCAGLLAKLVSEDHECSIVCATRGEACDPRRPASEMSTIRTAELKASAKVLGVQTIRWLDLPDGKLDDFSGRDQHLANALDELSPDLLLTHGLDGAYGHLDHIACSHMAMSVAKQTKQTMSVYGFAFSQGAFAPVWKRFSSVPNVQLSKEVPQGTPAEQVDLKVPIKAYAKHKRASLQCHASQLPRSGIDGFLIPGLFAKLLEEEWYCHLAGPALPLSDLGSILL